MIIIKLGIVRMKVVMILEMIRVIGKFINIVSVLFVDSFFIVIEMVYMMLINIREVIR